MNKELINDFNALFNVYPELKILSCIKCKNIPMGIIMEIDNNLDSLTSPFIWNAYEPVTDNLLKEIKAFLKLHNEYVPEIVIKFKKHFKSVKLIRK